MAGPAVTKVTAYPETVVLAAQDSKHILRANDWSILLCCTVSLNFIRKQGGKCRCFITRYRKFCSVCLDSSLDQSADYYKEMSLQVV